MKNNKKGLTLVELIVSFAIVGIAVIYFYKTTSVVNELYADSRKDISYSARKDYVSRILKNSVLYGDFNKVSASKDTLIFNEKRIPVKGLTSINYETCNVNTENGFIFNQNSDVAIIKFTFELDGETTVLISDNYVY